MGLNEFVIIGRIKRSIFWRGRGGGGGKLFNVPKKEKTGRRKIGEILNELKVSFGTKIKEKLKNEIYEGVKLSCNKTNQFIFKITSKGRKIRKTWWIWGTSE